MPSGGQGGASFMGHGNPTGDLGFAGFGEGGDVNMNGGQGAPYTEYDGNPYASNGGSAYNGGQGGSRGRCGRDGTCPGSDVGSPWATDGGFPGGGGGGSDVATGGYGRSGVDFYRSGLIKFLIGFRRQIWTLLFNWDSGLQFFNRPD